jgi:hypothetical protein
MGKIAGCMFMVVVSAFVSPFAFINLMETGGPIWAYALVACGVCFGGGWVAAAFYMEERYDD